MIKRESVVKRSAHHHQLSKLIFFQGQRGITGDDLRIIAMTKVIEGTVFTIEVTNVGDVYSKLAKYKLGPKLTLQDKQG